MPPTSAVQPLNMSSELETLSVLQSLPAWMVVKEEQPWNMLTMLVTLAVFQVVRSIDGRFWQNWNILFAFVIPLVLTLVRSMLVHCLKFLNSSVQSPVKLTWLVAVTLLTFPAVTSLPHLLSLLNSPQMSVSEPSVLLYM